MNLENNYSGYALRYEGRDEELKVGEIIEIGCHWSYEESNSECFASGQFVYRFECEKIQGHKIDYSKLDDVYNEEEYDDEYAEICLDLGINADCHEEHEVVVKNRKFKVLSVEEVWYLDDGTMMPRNVEVEMI